MNQSVNTLLEHMQKKDTNNLLEIQKIENEYNKLDAYLNTLQKQEEDIKIQLLILNLKLAKLKACALPS